MTVVVGREPQRTCLDRRNRERMGRGLDFQSGRQMSAYRVLALAVIAALIPRETGFAQQPRIVDNPAPNGSAPSFIVAPQPLFSVGGLNDDQRYELLAVSDAELTPAGHLIVASGSGSPAARRPEIRIFDAKGQFVRRFGRTGQGPGAFELITSIALLAGDSLAIVDNNQRRITVVDLSGNVGATSPYPGIAVCCFADGSYLTTPLERRRTSADPWPRARPRVPYSLTSVRSPNALASPVLTIEGSDPTLAFSFTAAGGRIGNTERSIPFGRLSRVAVTASEIIYGIGDRYEYNVYSREGTLLRTVRAAVPPVTISRAQALEQRAEMIASAPTERRSPLEKALTEVPLATSQPAYGPIEVEADGTVWIRNYQTLGSGVADAWWARFDPAGKLLGTLRLPPGRTLVRFSRGHVVLSNRDPDTGAIRLHVHRIEPARP